MPRISTHEAKEAFDRNRRSAHSKLMDKVFARKPEFVLNPYSQDGHLFLNDQRTYDFRSIDDGVYRALEYDVSKKELPKKQHKRVQEIRANYQLQRDLAKQKNAQDATKSYVEKLRQRMEEKKKPKKVDLTKAMEPIQALMRVLNSTRVTKAEYEDYSQRFRTIANAAASGDFYPTPEIYGQRIYDKFKEENPDFEVYDIAAGLGSLSIPWIENKRDLDVEKVTLVEMNSTFANILKGFEVDKKVNVIQGDFLKMTANDFKKKDSYSWQVWLCNPPFSGYNTLHDEDKRVSNFYYDFFFHMLNIIHQQDSSRDSFIYLICPHSAFNIEPRIKYKPTDSMTHQFFEPLTKIPATVLKKFAKLYPNLVTYDEEYKEYDIDLYMQCKYLGDVEGFRKLSRGKPVDMGLKLGLFEFLVKGNY